MACGTLHELDGDRVLLPGMVDDEGREGAIVTRRGPHRPTHDSVRVSPKVGEEIVEESSPGNASVVRPEHLAQGFAANPGAAPFVRDRQTPPAYAVLAALKLTPADGAGSHDDHTAIATTVRTDAGGLCVSDEDRVREWIFVSSGQSQLGWFARTRKRKAGR